MREKIKTISKDLRPDLIRFLREIIAIPSVCGNEDAVIKRLKQEMENIGYDKVWTDPLGNLIGTMGSGKRIIAFDGHCDTVDVGNPELWNHDPFKGKHENGIIYGRGASDQKGGLVSALYLPKILKETGIPADVTVLVVASILEENVEGLAWKYIIEKDKITPDAVIITEPTNNRINLGQRGRLEIKVKTNGVSCHGSAPERGDNAIYKMAAIIREIEQLNGSLESNSILGKGTVAISDIVSTAPSLCAVADSCTIHLDRRLTEGETIETCIEEIRALPSVNSKGDEVWVPEYKIRSYTGEQFDIQAYCPMWLMNQDDHLVTYATETYKNHFKEEAETGIWNFSTNGIATKGIHSIPTIGFGPGNEIYAHTADDQLNEEELTTALELYAALALNF